MKYTIKTPCLAFLLALVVAFIGDSFLIVTNASSQEYPEGMVSCWKFDEGSENIVKDSVGGYHGTIYDATWTTGRIGGALRFDGSNDFVQTPLNSNFLPLTIEAWFKTGDYVGGEQSVVDSDVSGHWGHSIIIGYWNGDETIDIQYHNSHIDTGYRALPNTWYHVVVGYTTDRITVFINGQLIVDTPYYLSLPLDGSNFRFGRHNEWDPQWFNGVIDEVAVYNRILTSEEIDQHYQNGLNGISSCEAPQSVYIDIKPISWPNSINLNSKGNVPVAILSTPAFDAAAIDIDSIVFAGAKPQKCGLEDIDLDGDVDLACHFPTQELVELSTVSTMAVLTGKTYDGRSLRGEDSIYVVPAKSK